MSRGILFVMSGPSGTGKGTICEELLKTEDIFLSVSSTTREIRKGEVDGHTYNYTTRENFERLIAAGEMLEYAEYNGNYYGTPRRTVEEMLSEGKNVLLEIEPQGALKIKSMFPEAVLVFVLPPSMAELKKRLIERGRETEEQIKERMDAAKWEMEQSPKYSYVVVNDELQGCVNEVADILHRRVKDSNFVDKLLRENY
ncbi:MAG: guanylate kinase [Oscillospiraceae bacterium]|nr:guanylate kinase [Oscillospiraceae bacterium]